MAPKRTAAPCFDAGMALSLCPIYLMARSLERHSAMVAAILLSPSIVGVVAVHGMLKVGFRRIAFYTGISNGVWLQVCPVRFKFEDIFVHFISGMMLLAVLYAMGSAYMEGSSLAAVLTATFSFVTPLVKSIEIFKDALSRQSQTNEGTFSFWKFLDQEDEPGQYIVLEAAAVIEDPTAKEPHRVEDIASGTAVEVLEVKKHGSRFWGRLEKPVCGWLLLADRDDATGGVRRNACRPPNRDGKVMLDVSLQLESIEERDFLHAGRYQDGNPFILAKENPVQESQSHDIWTSDFSWLMPWVGDGRRDHDLAGHSHGVDSSHGTHRLLRATPHVSACLVMVISSLSVGFCMNHLAFSPRLTRLELNAGLLMPEFSPNYKMYSVLLPTSQKTFAYFAQVNPQHTRSMRVAVPFSSYTVYAGSTLNTTANSPALLPGAFPARLNITMSGPLQQEIYSLYVRPVHMVVKALVLKGMVDGKEFQRCIYWGQLDESYVTIPRRLENITMEVSTTEVEIGIPVVDRHDIPRQGAFVTYFISGIDAAECLKECRSDPQCVHHLPIKLGCYHVRGPDKCFDNHQRGAVSNLVGDEELKRYLSQETIVGHFCYRDIPDAEMDEVPDDEADCHAFKETTRGLLQWRAQKSQLRWVGGELKGILQIRSFNKNRDDEERIECQATFVRGAPSVALVLTKIENLDVDVKVDISDSPSIHIYIKEYDAAEVEGQLRLRLVPIVRDMAYKVEWKDHNVELEELQDGAKEPIDYPGCTDNPGLQRFRACGGQWRSYATLLKLNAWRPYAELTMVLRPEAQLDLRPVLIPVTISTEGDVEPRQWLVRKNCALPEAEDVTLPVAKEIAQRCSSPEAMRLVRSYIRSERNTWQAAEVFVHVGANPKIDEFLGIITEPEEKERKRKVLDMVSLNLLTAVEDNVTGNGLQHLMERICEQMSTKDLMVAFGTSVKPHALAACMAKKGVEKVLRKAFLCRCHECVKNMVQVIPESEADQITELIVLTDESYGGCYADEKGTQDVHVLAAAQQDASSTLAETLRILKNLEVLVLHDYIAGKEDVDVVDAGQIADALKDLQRLRVLGLSRNNGFQVAENQEVIAEALSELNELQELQWSFQAVHAPLSKALVRLPKLVELAIGQNGGARGHYRMTDDEVAAFGRALGSGMHLQELNMEECDLESKHTNILLPYAAKLENLTVLELAGNIAFVEPEPAAWQTSLDALKQMKTLVQLDIRPSSTKHRPFSIEFVQAFVDSLMDDQVLPRLAKLKVEAGTAWYRLRKQDKQKVGAQWARLVEKRPKIKLLEGDQWE
eukprot:TRINITY_DN12856_c0_g1_i7.p1 TRINITY_DN12856_c0_g1~~TRINITY_DN12856_c0_g1_i7.p1  ORF type:complete len:1306 (+),score=285.96 TRINITY_DN12856_c0_g1_i7:1063-4980(+)